MPEEIPKPPPKTIVLCLDGTGDFAAENPTHVFRLFWALARTPRQVVYYDGGVGTLADDRIQSRIRRKVAQNVDLGTGISIRRNVVDAYRFLSERYVDGDRIVIFGYSRGSYAARALCGLIHWTGIPYPDQENIANFAWAKFFEMADHQDSKEALKADWSELARMRSAFARPAKVHFLGIWDTVSSFGILRQRTIPQTAKLSAVETVRHAVSIDERRNMFAENLISKDHPDGRERWFAGVHRDVGGGGNTDSLGLGMIAFYWILGEAKGLLEFKEDTKLLDAVPPDPCGKANLNVWIDRLYALIGFLPTRRFSMAKGRYAWVWLDFFHVRPIPPGAEIDPTVYERMKCPGLDYRPKNVPPGP